MDFSVAGSIVGSPGTTISSSGTLARIVEMATGPVIQMIEDGGEAISIGVKRVDGAGHVAYVGARPALQEIGCEQIVSLTIIKHLILQSGRSR